MTRTQITNLIAEMEAIHAKSEKAPTISEQLALLQDYDRLWKIVKPYVSGVAAYTKEAANA